MSASFVPDDVQIPSPEVVKEILKVALVLASSMKVIGEGVSSSLGPQHTLAAAMLLVNWAQEIENQGARGSLNEIIDTAVDAVKVMAENSKKRGQSSLLDLKSAKHDTDPAPAPEEDPDPNLS